MIDSLTIEMPLPPPSLRPNGRVHWSAKGRCVKEARGMTKLRCLAALAGQDAPRWADAVVATEARFPTARHWDPDNILAALKAHRDGIQDAGIVANDRALVPLPPAIVTGSDSPGITLRIYPRAKAEESRLLCLLADIRAAAGDPNGKLMQDELVAHIRKLWENSESYRKLITGGSTDPKRFEDAKKHEIAYRLAVKPPPRRPGYFWLRHKDPLRGDWMPVQVEVRHSQTYKVPESALVFKKFAWGGWMTVTESEASGYEWGGECIR